jgi:pimeloyl-ACP methyl ester carboxylesterase
MNPLPTLVMLHGSRGSTQELLPFAQHMVNTCNPILPNLLGHGGRPIPEHFTVHDMALDILAQMNENGVESSYLFGYSFGGYVALYLAKHAPHRIRGVCTLATKFVFDQATVDLFTHLSSVERIRNRQKELMDQRHPGQNWDRLVSGLADLYRQLGQAPALAEDDLRGIKVPTLVISANDDQLVPWSESLKLAYRVPHGQGFTFAGKAHPIDIIPVPFLASVIASWMECVSSNQAPFTADLQQS